MEGHSVTRREVAEVHRGWLRTLARSPWLLGMLALLLLVAGGAGMVSAASGGAPNAASAQGTVQAVAVSSTDRLASWLGQVGQELDDYAAAIVGSPAEPPAQLDFSLQTFLTGTADFSLLELTDLSGGVIAASNGQGISVAGAPWLTELSATPLVTPISQSGGSLQWLVARLAATGDVSGILVGDLQASQVADLLSPADTRAAPTVEAVLPGGLLLYSSTMTSTLHAGLTSASMVADGALSARVASPAVTDALGGGTGGTTYTSRGVSTVAGYDSVSLPGWEIGIVVSEPSVVLAASAPGTLASPWLVPSLLTLAGVLVLGMALGWRPRALAAVTGRLRPRDLLPREVAARRPAPRPVPSHDTASEDAATIPSSAVHPPGRRMAVARPSPAPLVLRGGKRLRGRYEILEVIGQGGEGQVLRALDHLHSRQVAIKVRCLDAGDRAHRREILNEASVLLRMAPDPHASVLREDFILGDRYYLVMDWIDGTPLDRVLAERGAPGLPLDDVVRWMGQVAGVLDHLHDQVPPVVHGDVKPGNVILTSDVPGRAILVDFGISRRRDGGGEPAAERGGGPVMGSPGYVAPEVLMGVTATPASDVFSLAATAFALLAGHPPRLGEAPHWAAVSRAAAPAVEAAFRAGLAVDPGRRPPSAGTFALALRSAVVPLPEREPPTALPAGL